MTTLQAAEAHTRVRAITLLFEEEQASAATLGAEAAAATLKLAPTNASSSSTPSPPPSGGDATINAMLHAHAWGYRTFTLLSRLFLILPLQDMPTGVIKFYSP
jgi:hypothetical protein